MKPVRRLSGITRSSTHQHVRSARGSGPVLVFPTSPMSSAAPMTSSSSSNFLPIFNAALETYEKTTKNKLLTHPFAIQLQSCDSPAAILTVLRDLIHRFDQSRSGNERLRNWLDPTVNVLFAFSATLGEGVGLVILQVIIQ